MYLRSVIVAIISSLLLVGCPKEIAIPIDPPVARKDYAQTPINTPVTLAPLVNDHDPNAEALTVIAIGTPSNGTATLNLDYTIDYTPNTGFTGGDSFTVTISDASGNEAIESAYITVGPSLRFLYFSNFEDYFTRQLYLLDTTHPEVGLSVNQYLRITDGPNITESTVENYSISSDRTTAVLLADDSDESNARNLFVVDLTRLGVATQVTDFPAGQGTSAVIAPALTLDNAYVVYLSNEFNALSIFELVMVEVAKPVNRFRLNPALVTGQTIRSFQLTPDGSRVLYSLTETTSGFTELYATEFVNPGVAVKLSGTPTAATGGVLDLTTFGGMTYNLVPGSTKVVYPATEAGATVVELWQVDYLNPAAPVKVSGTAVFAGVLSYLITNDGTRVIYAAPELDAAQTELFMAPLTVPGPSVRLNTPRTGTFAILNYGVGQDSTFAIYLSDQATAGVNELFKVDLASPGVVIKLNAPLATDVDINTFALSPSQPRTVLFSTFPDPLLRLEQQIYAVDVDVPGTVSEVGPRITNANVVVPIFAPDGATVLYSADPEQTAVTSIYAVRFDTPNGIVKLTPERYSGAEVSALRFLP